MIRFSTAMTFAQRNFLFLFIAAISTVVIQSGCSTTQQAAINHSLSASEIIAFVNAQADSIQTFSAYGSINVETPTMGQDAGFDLAVKKPDSVRIVVEGPFGITLAKALFTKHRFIAYNVLNNTVYEGNPSQGMTAVPMMSSVPPEILIDALSGVRRFTDTTTEPDSFYTTDESYSILFSGPQAISKFTVDPNSMRIARVKTFTPSGELLLDELYSYQQLENGQWRPSTAKIVVPKKSMTLEISFDEITINGPIGSMLITIPEDAERATIQ